MSGSASCSLRFPRQLGDWGLFSIQQLPPSSPSHWFSCCRPVASSLVKETTEVHHPLERHWTPDAPLGFRIFLKYRGSFWAFSGSAWNCCVLSFCNVLHGRWTWWTGDRWWICAEAMLDIFNKKYTASETVTSMLFYGAISTAAIAAWSWDSGQTVHGCLNCADGSAVGKFGTGSEGHSSLGAGDNEPICPDWLLGRWGQLPLAPWMYCLLFPCRAFWQESWTIAVLVTFRDVFFLGASFCNPFALFSLFSTPSRYCLLKAWENLGVLTWRHLVTTLGSGIPEFDSQRPKARLSSTLMPLRLARHDLSHLNSTATALKHLRQPGNIMQHCVNFVKSLEICDGIGVLYGFMKFHVWFHGSICGRMHCFYSSFQVSVHWVYALSLGCLAQRGDSFTITYQWWNEYLENM